MKQPWTLRVGECLFCSFRPNFAPAITFARPFTSTPLLERSQPKSKPLSKRPSGRFGNGFRTAFDAKFDEALETALKEFKYALPPSDPLLEKWDSFYRRITSAARIKLVGLPQSSNSGMLVNIRAQLVDGFKRAGPRGIREELELVQKDLRNQDMYGNPHATEQQKATDFRYPAEWYPYARSRQRTIHLHVGPTNSGKTYRALKRLEQAKLGFYAGPLRLLAQEVYTRFNAEGIPCNLVTGDEVRTSDTSPRIISNTVEMVSIYKDYDVGVIDEIQMIADPDRGWAWTRAFLGSRAKELHVCGEERAVPLIKELATLMGDNLEIHHYQRLNPLRAESKSLNGDLRNLRKGDAIVTFSRINIHALKSAIERSTGKRAAIVYGGLPAEIRTQQANLFNDPDNDYDYLVASDAIGMGLNLKCKRVIFQTLVKNTKNGLARISIPEIKQIGGRAGRYRAANETGKRSGDEEENVGLVTSLEDVDLPFIQKALDFSPPPLKAAGVIPTDAMFYRVASYFPPDVSFRFLINRVCSVSKIHPLFFMCQPRSQLEVAGFLDRCDRLSIEDQIVFMAAPMNDRDQALMACARGYVRCVANNSSGRLLDIHEINLEILEEPVSGKKDYLNELESLHKALILYLWLSYRMGGIFTDRTLATHVKEMVEERMMRALTEFSANAKLRKDASRHRQMLLEKQSLNEEQLLANAQFSGEADLSVGGEADSFDVPTEEDAPTASDGQQSVRQMIAAKVLGLAAGPASSINSRHGSYFLIKQHAHASLQLAPTTMPIPLISHGITEGLSAIPHAYTAIKWTAVVAVVALLKYYFGGARNTSERLMHSKVVMITGGTSGIGASIVHDLASRGAQIILLTQHAPSDLFLVDYIEDLRQSTNNELIYAEQVDLASLHSIRKFATKWVDNAPPRRLDMIILCANTIKPTRHGKPRLTPDGLDEEWQVNYLANFHLLSILSPAIRAQPPDRDVRIVVASCSSYIGAEIDLKRTEGVVSQTTTSKKAATTTTTTKNKTKNGGSTKKKTKRNTSASSMYGMTKLSLMIFAKAFQKHLSSYKRPDQRPMNARVLIVDPGWTRTPGTRRWITGGSLWGLLLYLITWPVWWLVLKAPEQGAQSFLYAAMEAKYGRGEEGGWFIKECREFEPLRKEVGDDEVAKQLWEFSEDQIQVKEKESAKRRAVEKALEEEERKKREEAEKKKADSTGSSTATNSTGSNKPRTSGGKKNRK